MLPTWSMYLVDKYHISADLKPRKKNGKKSSFTGILQISGLGHSASQRAMRVMRATEIK